MYKNELKKKVIKSITLLLFKILITKKLIYADLTFPLCELITVISLK